MRKQNYHIDTSGRFYEKGESGIACVSDDEKEHYGCVLRGKVKREIEKRIFPSKKQFKEEYAKLYAICIYYLIKDKTEKIEKLIICNDEIFQLTKKCLILLLDGFSEKDILSIADFRRIFGKKTKSCADNHANSYRRRGAKEHKWNIGRKLNLVKIDFNMIKESYNKL